MPAMPVESPEQIELLQMELCKYLPSSRNEYVVTRTSVVISVSTLVSFSVIFWD
jgi:hypothetical protein